MSEFMARLGQVLSLVGFLMAIGAQLYAFWHIIKTRPVKAILVLLLPGYLLYYVWLSDGRMPRALHAWFWGVVFFVTGGVIVGLAV